jgi:hypothetical protein
MIDFILPSENLYVNSFFNLKSDFNIIYPVKYKEYKKLKIFY